jgi:hypothetical protein
VARPEGLAPPLEPPRSLGSFVPAAVSPVYAPLLGRDLGIADWLLGLVGLRPGWDGAGDAAHVGLFGRRIIGGIMEGLVKG